MRPQPCVAWSAGNWCEQVHIAQPHVHSKIAPNGFSCAKIISSHQRASQFGTFADTVIKTRCSGGCVMMTLDAYIRQENFSGASACYMIALIMRREKPLGIGLGLRRKLERCKHALKIGSWLRI
jgi:hypothetical protein